MRHIRALSALHPVQAQLDSVIQLVGLLSSLLALYEYASNLFGIPIPDKTPDQPAA